MWQVRMLGRFEVISEGSGVASFRSRKVGSLLAFLTLNRGKSVSNATLQELLWPDSDGDRQAQSLRRAIADLRDVLENDSSRGALIRTEKSQVWIEESSLESDVRSFEELLSTSKSNAGFELRATEAIALYGGPLLAPIEDEWIEAYRRQFEDLYCRAVLDLCRQLSLKGDGKEAARIANASATLAPLREEPFIASIHAYASLGNNAMAIRQYEALEKMLDDHFGQSPSEAATLALETVEIVSQLDSSPILDSGGAVDVESRFYVERAADSTVQKALRNQEAVILVFGPRQTGKSSMLARTAFQLRGKNTEVAVTDFQALSRSELERPTTFYRSLIHSLATQLGVPYEPSWNEWVGPNSNLNAQVEAIILQVNAPVCWAMDEVDRIFGQDYTDDFFGLVRSWHNRRALAPDGPWKRLSLLISYATEAHLFIKDLNQSPFNIGVRASLRDFSESEVMELGNRYGSQQAENSKAIYEMTGGHPYLSRRAYSFLVSGNSINSLRESSLQEDGPFSDHLKHLLNSVQREPEVLEAVSQILKGGTIDDKALLSRMISAGVLQQSFGSDVQFRAPIYEAHLRENLTKK